MRGAARPARRAFLAAGLAAGAMAAWGAPAVRRLGYLSGGATDEVLAEALAPLGWVAGRNLRIETRVANKPETWDAAARELVATNPEVIVAWSGARVTALLRATRSIPIVVGAVSDAVALGFAKTLARPGGNVTGLSYNFREIAPVHIAMLRAVVPSLRRVHAFESGQTVVGGSRFFESTVRESGLAYEAHRVEDEAAARQAIAKIPNAGKDSLVVFPVPVDYPVLAAAVNERRLVSTGYHAEYATEGGLMACQQYFPDHLARIVAKVNEILRGGNPAEMPFELPTHTKVVLNRRTAAAIGTKFPADLVLRATDVIE
jgi:putative ABC transport system substrate-binding protein